MTIDELTSDYCIDVEAIARFRYMPGEIGNEMSQMLQNMMHLLLDTSFPNWNPIQQSLVILTLVKYKVLVKQEPEEQLDSMTAPIRTESPIEFFGKESL